MVMKTKDQFPFKVPYYRTDDWYWNGGTWYKLSNWCTDTFGFSGHDWDYVNSHFVFKDESHKTMFMLRWG